MSVITAGIDVGSTYTKAVLCDGDERVVAKAYRQTGFKLAEAAAGTLAECVRAAGLEASDVKYVISTGFGRHQVDFKDASVTDLTAGARGAKHYFPGTRTVLDIGGQTMKVSRVDERGKVKSFRLNDKCAAGTGAFLEKTARYMGYETDEVGPLAATGKEPATISGVCAVFAESEVINHLSIGTSPSDIMLGAIESLVGRCVQLMRRAKAEPEYVLVGGLLRYRTMAEAVKNKLEQDVAVPPDDMCQFAAALGAALLGQARLRRIAGGHRDPIAAAS